jgi:uncharacterized protein (TIGR02996 family)
MNDQELSQHELFPAIAREPRNDEARLVLADALIEAGDPRGELITMQCELARVLGTHPPPPEGWRPRRLQRPVPEKVETRSRQITRQQNKLLKEHPEWTPPAEIGRFGVQFWRGFISAISVFDLGSWDGDRLRRLLDSAPIASRIYLFGATRLPELVRALGDHPVGTSLQMLMFSGGEDAQLGVAMADARLPALERLVFFGHQVTCAETVAAICANPSLTRLRSFTLDRYASLTAEDVVSLLRAPHFTLDELIIPEAELGPAGAKALAEQEKLEHLTTLDISKTNIGPEGLSAILGSAHAPKQLERLAVAKLKLKKSHLPELAESSTLSNLRVLDLDSNRIGAEGIQALAGSKRLRSLQALHLRNCWIADEGVGHLVASPLMAQLQDLNLRSNNLTDDAARTLGQSPHARGLVKLNINNNGITQAGAGHLWDSEHLAGCRIFTDHTKPREKKKAKKKR